MVVYQSIPILIRNPLACRIWRRRVKYSKCSTSLYDNIFDILICLWLRNIQIWKSKTHYTRNHRYYYRLFYPFLVSINRGLNSCDSCVSSCWVSINADWFGKCRADFNFKAIQWDIIGNECSDLPYRILSGGPVIAGIYMQANQVFVKSGSISTSFPSLESYNLILLTATLISLASIVFAIFLNRNLSNQVKVLKK